MPPPAIAFDLTPLQNAHRFRGIGTYVRGLAQRLALQDEIPIEFWGWAGVQPFDVHAPHSTLWLPRLPMPEYRGSWLFAQLAMRRRAGRSAVSAVHITDPEALTPLSRRKLLATVYDLIPLQEGVGRRRMIAWAGYRSYLRAMRRVDTFFAISGQTATDLVHLLGVPPERVVVAPPGIDLPESTGTTGTHARPYFLFMGGPNPNKNLSLLLDAMSECGELSEELQVAGHWLPKQVAVLQAQLRARGLHDRVRHVGFVPEAELAQLMTDATALVIPSRQEGFGLPVGEGLAAGAVVIHSRISVLEETSAGAAMTFALDSTSDLAACMRRAAADGDVTREMRKRGVERARELTWDAAVERTLAVYRAALGR